MTVSIPNLKLAKNKSGSRKTITITITMDELHTYEMDHPRELVAKKFADRGYVVINYPELRYFNRPTKFIVEGTTGLSLMSK
jgi:hypothetical protein